MPRRKQKAPLPKRVIGAVGNGVYAILAGFYGARVELMILVLALMHVQTAEMSDKRLEQVRLQVASISYKNFEALASVGGKIHDVVVQVHKGQYVLATNQQMLMEAINECQKPEKDEDK